MYKKYFKRLFDIIMSAAALILLCPVMLILALFVKIKLGSPVIFKQQRTGKNEKIFTILKFRTMTGECDNNGELLPDELRLTKFGRFLRSTSLDELPELINIIKGDMSLVGPRPLPKNYLPFYSETEKLRHTIRPGLTGLAQICGRNYITWEKKFETDLRYIREYNFIYDLKILLKTLIVVIKRKNIETASFIYHDGIVYRPLNIERAEKSNLNNSALKKERKNALIFSGGSYPAAQIYFCLKHSLLFKPFLASSYDDHSGFICREAENNLPYVYEDCFVEKINEFISRKKIEFIIPTHDTIALVLMQNQEKINAKIVCSPLPTTFICRYKSKTYEILKDFDFVPEVYLPNDLYGKNIYPVFAKDDEGQGGRETYLIKNDVELSEVLRKNLNFVLCEYLPGQEITVDCFTDRHGDLLFIQPRTRSRLLNGISARSQTVLLTDEIKNIILNISQKITFRGYWFAQLKQNISGKYKLMEISTRFSGTFGVSKSLDVNFPLLALCDFSEIDIEITPNKYNVTADKSYIDRYKINIFYERVYIDFDDTLVFGKKIYNSQMMMFVYQCINKGVELVLITKHENNIKNTMKNIKLNADLFSEIIEVPVDEYKYIYMNNNKPSIFIDNSYTERKLVKKYLNMPAFDVSNIDCLIDWRDD